MSKYYTLHPIYRNVLVPNFEEWRDIPGYEKRYQASTFGRIRSLGCWRKSRPGCPDYWVPKRLLTIFNGRYQSVSLHKNGRQQSRSVHDLILRTFIGPPPIGMNCRHYPDRNTTNNRLENLSWSTQLINQRDRFYHGTHSQGERNAEAKLKETDVILLRELCKQDKRIFRNAKTKGGRKYPYGRNVRLSKKLFNRTGIRITPTMVGYILRGQNWKCVT